MYFLTTDIVTEQSRIQPPAAILKHNTIIGEEEKRSLLKGPPVWGSGESQAPSHSLLQNTERSQPPPGAESVSRHTLHAYLSSPCPTLFHELSVSPALSLWSVHLWAWHHYYLAAASCLSQGLVRCQITAAGVQGCSCSRGQ